MSGKYSLSVNGREQGSEDRAREGFMEQEKKGRKGYLT